MRWIKILGILLIVSSQTLFAQKQEFEEANLAYEKGNFEQAIVKYQQLVSEGNVSANLHYNLGSAYYEMKQVANSILHLEKAKKLNPSDADIENNLRLAYLATPNQVEPLPQLFFVKWFHQFLSSNSASQWGKRAVLFAFLVLVFFALSKVFKKKFFNFFTIVSLILSICFSFLAFQKNSFDQNHDYAIIMKKQADLKLSPNESAALVLNVQEGLKVQVIDYVDSWTKVRLEDGVEAWLPSLYLERI